MKVFLFIFSIIALGKRGLTMDFKQLEAFVYVVKLKSFSKAAQRIYLTQPTISAHINSLEKELDTKLIERGTKYVYPTKPGSILYQYAVKMLNLREDTVCSVKNYNKELKGTLTICASTVPSQNILPKVIAAFREEYPHVTFNILRQDSELVVESISKGMADIGFCGTDTHNPDCVFESFIQDHLVIITPNTERFRQMRTTGIKADFLKTEPIILREEGSGTRKETEHFLAKAGIDIGELKIAAQFNDPDSIKHAVSQGMGISIISKAAVEDYENFGLLLSFDLSGISMDRHLYIVSHKNNPLSFIGEVFLNFVKMYYDK